MNVTLTNSHGQAMTLTDNPRGFQLFMIDGLDPGAAVINSQTLFGQDGTHFNSARLTNRSVVLYLKVNGDQSSRRSLYRLFPDKEPVALALATEPAVTITGHVSGLVCSPYEKKQVLQLTVLCDDPYFYGAPWTSSFSQASEFFTVQVTNNGDASAPLQLSLTLQGDLTELSIGLLGTRGLRIVRTLGSGVLQLDTGKQTLTFRSGRIITDLLPYLDLDSEFFTLPAGESSIYISCDDPNEDFVGSITVPTKIGGL